MSDILGTVLAVGGYVSPVKLAAMVVLAIPWLYAAPWVAKDARRVRAPEALWNGAVLGAGALGMLLWLVVPVYAVGLLLYVVLSGATLSAYIVYRNGRVKESHRIFTGEWFQRLTSRRKAETIVVEQLVKIYDSHNKIVLSPPPGKADPGLIETYNLAQNLLHDMVWRRASRVDIAPAGQQAAVRYEIDGVVIPQASMNLADSEALINFLKAPAGMDAQERRRPQEGHVSVDITEGGHATDIVLTTAGTTGGQRMQFQLVKEAIRTNLEELGMTDDVLRRVGELNLAGNGFLIVSGPPRSGVTSTLYSLLKQHDAFIRQLVTLEKQPVVDLENITQHTYADDASLAATLAAALRRDPDVVMIDQCPDAKTAQLICDAAGRKSLLLGMHATDAFQALAKWVKVSGDPVAATKNLRGVLCQALLRKLCPTCREAYRPDPQLLAKANLGGQQIDSFYRPPTKPLVDEKGNPVTCPSCQGSGYVARTAAFELLEITDELRQMVAQNASLSQIKAACRKNRMLYLQEEALRKVIDGVTSIQEVIRVTQHAKKS